MSKRKRYIEAITNFGKRKKLPLSKFVMRNSAYGIFVIGDEVLLVTNYVNGKLSPPGGAVELGEFTERAIKRECLEEIGTDQIHVGRLIGIAQNFFYYDPTDQAFQVIMHFYEANLLNKKQIKNGGDADEGNPQWYKVSDLKDENFGELLSGSILNMIRQAWG